LLDETLDEMQVLSVRQNNIEGYGIGWKIYDGTEDHCMIGHGGGMDGVDALLKMVPAAQVVVAILTNTSGNRDLAEQVVVDTLSVLLPTYAEKRAKGIWQRKQHSAWHPEVTVRWLVKVV